MSIPLRWFAGACFIGLTLVIASAAQHKAAAPEVITRLKGHGDTVYTVAFSPDGKYLVTGSLDHTLKLWEAGTGKEIKTYGGPTGHQKMVLAVAFSPDGQLIASGSADNTLKVWDVPVGSPIRSLKTGDNATAVALTADSARAAIGGKDGSIRIVTAADFKEVANCAGHQGTVTGLAFSANGQQLVSTSSDRTLRIWNAANGQPVATVGAHSGSANAVAFNPNGAIYTVGDDGLLKFWQLPPTPATSLPGHTAAIHALALSGDGNLLVSGGEDKTVRQFAAAGAKEIRALTGPQAPVGSVALSANNTQVAAGSTDQHVYLWNAADGKSLGRTLAHTGGVTGVQFNPQGTQLATAGTDGMVKTWALPPQSARTITHPDAVLVALASPDGKKLYTGSADKIVRVWDALKPAIERQLTGHTAPVTALAVSANGQTLISGGADATIRVWNQAAGKEADVLIAHAGPITSLALNAAGNQLVSTGEDGMVKLWQLPAVPPKTFIHPDQVAAITLTPDGSKLLTGSGDRVVRLWNLATGAKEREYTGGPTLPIAALALSGNGATIAAAALDKTLTLWNAADGKLLHKATVPAVPQTVAFAPDNQHVAVGLGDGSIKLIKTGDAKEAKTLAGHKGGVTGLVFSPKGDLLYSAGADKAIQAWTMPGGTVKTKLDHDAAISSLTVSKDGALIAAAGAKSVELWNSADGKVIASWSTPADVRGIALAPDKSRIVLAGSDKLARVYQIDGRLIEAVAHDGPVQAAAFIDAKRLVTAAADKTVRLWTSALTWQQPHGGPARRALFTPKGDQVLSAGDDKAIRAWNAADGKSLKVIANPEGTVTQLGISADGARLASAGADKTVKVWTLADGKPAASLGVAGPVQALALSPSGQRVAVTLADAMDSAVHVYDVSLGREVQSFADHTAPVRSLAFQPDNRTLVTGSLDKTARLLDSAVLTALPAHPAGRVHLLMHASGTQVLTAGADKTLKLWDTAKGAVLKMFGPLTDPVAAIAFSKDYTQVAAAAGKAVKVWNVADGKEVVTLTHPADVLSVAFNADKTRIATGATDKQTRLWEVASARELQFFPEPDAVEAVALAPSGFIVSAAGKMVNVEPPAIARVIPAGGGPLYALALAPTNTHVLTAGADKAVKLWNVANGTNERTFAGATAALRAVAISKNNLLLAAGGADQTVRLYQFADAKELGAVKAGGEVRSLSFTPNNLALLASADDKTLRAWSTPFNPGQPPAPEFLAPVQSYSAAEPVQQLAIAGDNATIYTAGLDKAMHVWKLASPAPVRNFPHPNNVDAVAFQPKGTFLASGGHDGKVRLFDLVKGAQVKEITAHVEKNAGNTIYSITFSADGKQLVTSSYDRSLKLWDVASGNLVREFKAHKVKDFEKGHTEPVYSAAISPDGKWLASGSHDRTIKIWSVVDGSVVRDLPNPTLKSVAHPGDVLQLHFTRDGKLISLGDAPKNRGFLAVWDPQAGKMLFGETLPMGTFFSMAVAPDERTLAVATGSRGRSDAELNNVYLIKVPQAGK
jgi:WD40 repeat protein